MLTTAQIKWAASHDWFIQDNGDGTILVHDCFTENGRYFQRLLLWDQSFAALRDWAGY